MLDELLDQSGMSLTELGERVYLTLANLSILMTGMANAIRCSNLQAMCRVLECQPGDFLAY